MKKFLLSILLVTALSTCLFSQTRRPDRDWSFTTVSANSTAKRITNTQSGLLFVENHNADTYIAFNATANVSSIKISDGGWLNTGIASVRIGEYITLYSEGNATVNYVILD